MPRSVLHLMLLLAALSAGCSAARVMERPEREGSARLRATRALVRETARACEVPIDANWQVVERVEALRSSYRRSTVRLLSSAGRYLPLFWSELDSQGVPRDLAMMVFVESGFNPLARSKSDAVGLWQFLPSTGKRFDLRIDAWVDERRDPEKSTRAAARYLRWMFDQFRDWRLVIAGYHCGRLNVQGLIDRQGTRNVWELNLPKETRDYVVSVMAAVVVARRPEAFGLTGIVREDPLDYDEVPVEGNLLLEKAAHYARTDEAELRRLNPELRKTVTPPGVDVYRLRVPIGRGERFAAAYYGGK